MFYGIIYVEKEDAAERGIVINIIFQIFYNFSIVGALTFGGGYTMLPLLQKNIAEKKGWVTMDEITDYYAIAQCLPGIIAVNTAMLAGYRIKKVPGLVAAALGMIFPSLIIILAIAIFIRQFMDYEVVQHAFTGIRAAILALIVLAVVRMWKNGVKDLFCFALFVITLAVFVLYPVSPVWPILICAVCGIAVKPFLDKRGGK